MSQIRDFFKNQTIFLTGGSGFLGKILIEKLLRVCPDLKTIYVLIRSKKGKTPEQRFDELFSYACFDRLKATNIELLEKVTLMSGDCQEPFMGLSDQNLEILKRETTCVIHAAADVKFDKSLKEQTNNVKSTRDLIQLAKQMSNLTVFLYVSTAYSNCIHSHIKEDFYEPPLKAENLFAVVDNLGDDVVDAITPNLLGKWPNTYVYTKSISEDLMREASKDLPVAIVRPAIVSGTKEEPMPGWIDNFYGVVGIVVAAALGVLKSLHAKKDNMAAIVPADYVGNCILAAAWKRGSCDNTAIYNYTGSRRNAETWRQFMGKMEIYCWNVPTDKVMWYYSFKLRENKLWHKICIFFMHTVVSYIVDFFLVCAGRPPLAVKNYQRLNKMIELLSYFSTRSWEFDGDNTEQLWKEMGDEDKKLFHFDMDDLDWDSYHNEGIHGARLHLLKDTPDTIDKGYRKIRILFVAHYTILALFWYFIYKLVSFILSFFW